MYKVMPNKTLTPEISTKVKKDDDDVTLNLVTVIHFLEYFIDSVKEDRKMFHQLNKFLLTLG